MANFIEFVSSESGKNVLINIEAITHVKRPTTSQGTSIYFVEKIVGVEGSYEEIRNKILDATPRLTSTPRLV